MGAVPRSPNRLLANLTPADHELVRPHLHNLELVHAKVLVAAGNEIEDACLPPSGIISLVVRLIQGDTSEVAMIGRDSVFGASAALVGPTALTTAIVQSPGMCSALPIERLHGAAEQSGTFRTMPTRSQDSTTGMQ